MSAESTGKQKKITKITIEKGYMSVICGPLFDFHLGNTKKMGYTKSKVHAITFWVFTIRKTVKNNENYKNHCFSNGKHAKNDRMNLRLCISHFFSIPQMKIKERPTNN